MQLPPSFSSAAQLRDRIELLPSPPQWRSRRVVVAGGLTAKPLTFFYRDGLECFKHLFGNPLFSEHMQYVSQRLWASAERSCRVYTEIMTGDLVWDVQVRASMTKPPCLAD